MKFTTLINYKLILFFLLFKFIISEIKPDILSPIQQISNNSTVTDTNKDITYKVKINKTTNKISLIFDENKNEYKEENTNKMKIKDVKTINTKYPDHQIDVLVEKIGRIKEKGILEKNTNTILKKDPPTEIDLNTNTNTEINKKEKENIKENLKRNENVEKKEHEKEKENIKKNDIKKKKHEKEHEQPLNENSPLKEKKYLEATKSFKKFNSKLSKKLKEKSKLSKKEILANANYFNLRGEDGNIKAKERENENADITFEEFKKISKGNKNEKILLEEYIKFKKNHLQRKIRLEDNAFIFYNSLSLIMLSMLAGGVVGVIFILYFSFKTENPNLYI